MKTINKQVLTISFMLLLTISGILAIVPIAHAQQTSTRATAAYLSVNPQVIGVSQQLTVNAWIYPPPAGPTSFAQVLVYYHNVSVTFTRPDGTKDTFMPVDGSGGLDPGQTEAIGGLWFFYTPNQVGNWTLQISYPGETIYDKPAPNSVYYKPSTSQVVPFTVQSQQVQIGFPPVPLPTGYWTSPINSMNREWYQIGGGWLQTTYDTSNSYFNPYATAPNTGHVVWKLQTNLEGLVGGPWGTLSYEDTTPARNPIIMSGRVYVNMPGSVFQCIDLRSGQVLYTAAGAPTLILNLRAASRDLTRGTAETQGAAIIPSLWELGSGTWKRYNPLNGALLQTITSVPVPAAGSTPTMAGSFAAKFFEGDPVVWCSYLSAWNTTRLNRFAVNDIIKWDWTKVTGNNWTTGIVWRSSISPYSTPGVGDGRGNANLWLAGKAVVAYANGEDMMIAFNTDTGAVIWNKTLDYYNSNTGQLGPDGPCLTFDTVTRQYHTYDIATGNQLWVSDPIGQYPWGVQASRWGVAYGNFYVGTYDGHIYALDAKTGKVKFTSDYVGKTSELVYGNWAFYGHGAIADGKVYGATSEHSPTQPRPRGNMLVCMDAFTGKFLWNISGPIGTQYGGYMAVAEGYYVGVNEYDGFMYCIGKGESAVTVSAPTTTVAAGSSVLIQGTVTDQSPISKGKPAVADSCMSAWTNYLHMQLPLVGTITGVPVTLTAVAPDGKTINIGTVTSDSGGLFKTMWTPPSAGAFTIIANFTGTQSYWASCAETALGVAAAASAAPVATTQPTNPTVAPETSAPTQTSTPAPTQSQLPSASPTVAPPPPSSEAPSMTIYIATAGVLVIILVIAAVTLFMKKRK